MKHKSDYTPREIITLWKDMYSRFKVVHGKFDASGTQEQTEDSFVEFIKPSEKGTFLLYQWTLELPEILNFATGSLPAHGQFDSIGGPAEAPSRRRTGGDGDAAAAPGLEAAVRDLVAGQTSYMQAQMQAQTGQHLRELQAMLSAARTDLNNLSIQRHALAAVAADCGGIDTQIQSQKEFVAAVEEEVQASLPAFFRHAARKGVSGAGTQNALTEGRRHDGDAQEAKAGGSAASDAESDD
eukprot:GHVU01131930.1.p2 GENE.GHVU01131930.1~~GHVU01131930.1.p2  ORF type:complete len:240 (+),score=46.14 GHVU01131930.1:118-837(+)